MKRSSQLRAFFPLIVLVGACSSILGIEDVHPDAKPGGDAGDTGTGGTSGATSTGGTAGASAGKGGSAGAAGSAGKGGSGTAGDSGAGGEGDQGGIGGTAGTAGTGGTGDTTVRGRIVSFWQTPIPNVLVTIGAADDLTNANGEFEIADVAPTYDAEFVVDYTRFNSPRTYAWAYQGLTRRDPTLMVFEGTDQQSGDADLSQTGVTLATTRFVAFAFGSPGGADTYQEADTVGWSGASLYWEGPSAITARVHGLVWDTDADEIPTGYRAYTTQSVALNANETANVVLDLSDGTVSSGTLGGTVTSPTAADRTNNVWLRFTSNAKIMLVNQYAYQITDPATFSFLVPTIQNGSLTVAVTEGTASSGPAACAHRDGLAAGQLNVALTIPTPSTLISPADSSTVSGTTQFRWTGGNAVSVVHMEDIEPTDFIRGVYIVTSSDRVTVPTFGGAFQLISGAEHYWRVETHDDYADVDEAAGPEGFADPLGPSDCDEPLGPRQGSGTYAISGGRLFYPQ